MWGWGGPGRLGSWVGRLGMGTPTPESWGTQTPGSVEGGWRVPGCPGDPGWGVGTPTPESWDTRMPGSVRALLGPRWEPLRPMGDTGVPQEPLLDPWVPPQPAGNRTPTDGRASGPFCGGCRGWSRRDWGPPSPSTPCRRAGAARSRGSSTSCGRGRRCRPGGAPGTLPKHLGPLWTLLGPLATVGTLWDSLGSFWDIRGMPFGHS